MEFPTKSPLFLYAWRTAFFCHYHLQEILKHLSLIEVMFYHSFSVEIFKYVL